MKKNKPTLYTTHFEEYSITLTHVYLPVQVTPSPVYPELQVHVKLPTLLAQLASALQPPLFVSHSLISAFYKHLLVHGLLSNRREKVCCQLDFRVGTSFINCCSFTPHQSVMLFQALITGYSYYRFTIANIIIMTKGSFLVLQIHPNRFHFLSITICTRFYVDPVRLLTTIAVTLCRQFIRNAHCFSF